MSPFRLFSKKSRARKPGQPSTPSGGAEACGFGLKDRIRWFRHQLEPGADVVFHSFTAAGDRRCAVIYLQGMIMMLLLLVPILLIFGAQLAANLPYPFLETVRFIRVAQFLENVDPVLVSLWMTSFYVKISVCLYCAVSGVAQLLSLKDYRPLSYTGGLLMYGYSQQLVESVTELFYTFRYANASLGIVVESIPALYLAVHGVKKLAAKRKNKAGGTDRDGADVFRQPGGAGSLTAGAD